MEKIYQIPDFLAKKSGVSLKFVLQIVRRFLF